MTEQSFSVTQKLWSYCNLLRDDGLSYQDYLEQLTFLIFLKMDDERTKKPHNKKSALPPEYNWQKLLTKQGAELEGYYIETLQQLGKQDGMVGEIFVKAQNKIQNPALLERLIKDLIGAENWSSLSADVKGDAYEGLLQKNAEDVKGGAGQYFTPRALIQSIVEVMRPVIGQTICDPACGTGGFLLAAYDYLSKLGNLDPDIKRNLQQNTIYGVELVESVGRLCLMNLLLHGIEPTKSPIEFADALRKKHGEYDMVLTNPPFGKKSSITVLGADGRSNKESMTYNREEFWATTSNKQLNFLQHVYSILKENGRAAVVLPDNVLFEGGAGETVRRKLLHNTDAHTLLRLPTGIFYAQGVKANVLFFDSRKASPTPWTKELWIYDFRTNIHLTLKENPLKYEHLSDFIASYNAVNRHKRKESERFRKFTYEEITQRDKANLDILWLKDDSLEDGDNLPDPDIIAQEIAEDLQAALEQFNAIYEDLDAGK